MVFRQFTTRQFTTTTIYHPTIYHRQFTTRQFTTNFVQGGRLMKRQIDSRSIKHLFFKRTKILSIQLLFVSKAEFIYLQHCRYLTKRCNPQIYENHYCLHNLSILDLIYIFSKSICALIAIFEQPNKGLPIKCRHSEVSRLRKDNDARDDCILISNTPCMNRIMLLIIEELMTIATANANINMSN